MVIARLRILILVYVLGDSELFPKFSMDGINRNMLSFLTNLPKIELHAHLNGSLSTESIRELGLQLYGENNKEFLEKIDKFIQFPEEDKFNKCFQKFGFMHELTSSSTGLQLATEMVIRDFALDNVVYLEIRTTPKTNDNMTRKQYLDIILRSMQTSAGKYNILVKLLVSIDRSQGTDAATEILDLAIELKKTYPQLVKGIDFSGNPTKGKFTDFKPILKAAKNAGLFLALHCAEIQNDMETQEMLDFDFERCGHGTFMTEKQLEQCRRQNITVECCLTSNVKCGTVKLYDLHHFKSLFGKKIRTVLCTDDSGVFNTTLTQELSIACNVYGLNKQNIYDLCMCAVEASSCEEDEKNDLRKKIDLYFMENV